MPRVRTVVLAAPAPRPRRIRDVDDAQPLVSRAALRGLEELARTVRGTEQSRDVRQALAWIDSLSSSERNTE